MKFFDDLIDIKLEKNMGLCNLTDEFFCLILNKIYRQKHKNILIVVDSVFEANKIYRKLINYNDSVFLFPMDDFLTSEALASSFDLLSRRMDTLNYFALHDSGIIITNLMGYLRFLPEKRNYKKFIFQLKIGDIVDRNELVNKIFSCGYEKDALVNKTGEFSVRGFIIDIFPIDEDNPVRIEFFDNEIESIRYFNVDTQKSISKIDSIYIKPFSEFLTDKKIEEGHYGKQKFFDLYEKVSNISDYLGECYTFFKDYGQIQLSYTEILNEVEEFRKEKDVAFLSNYFHSLDSLKVDYPLYYFSFANMEKTSYSFPIINFGINTINNFNENIEAINHFLIKNINEKKTILICLRKFQIKSLLKHLAVKVVESSFDSIFLNSVNIIDGELSEGFIYQDFVVLTSHELFRNLENKKHYNTKFKYSKSIYDINKLEVGDYVVHNVHGIGVYNGIKTLSLHDITKDYLEILYQGTDKIYIPVEKIDLISKFSGKEGMVPKVNKLGGNEWKKTKARVKSKVIDMADQLIKLYAERESRKGFAFSKDCELSLAFENDFPYELTTDQKNAIAQIKKDMESPSPMDRLLCGDVGFGKTEVAFVAAFKAILDSKQVLFLCPTTILSKQHYENALIRFHNFPVSIALLNRFTGAKEVQRIITGLEDGTIDMVIGTHRLLSSDIKPRNLGLLVIDEEQRFGVSHKEKIKQYKTNVDVLTLTATPIPRTLQMSLVGIRSLSLIETPPNNRYPVQTYVVEENKQILKDAIYKELSRNGQVFILYNRVLSINEFFYRIQEIAPDARIAIAHGQMNKNQLEDTIYDFVNYKYDILICTTIIETGIDIPNVNTLIVIDADLFGLSQLYQIRGRVGRGDKFAYAYLMYQPFKKLTETAIKRLNVIKEFTKLGSGFSIATRDLSIRGAGDMLGSEQAGFIDSVGIDLYLKMLENEIRNIKHEPVIAEENIEDSKPLIDVTTHIEDSYVQEDDLKIEIHRLINSIEDKKTFNKVKEELEDRFGKISEDLLIYMYEEWFEKLAKKLKIENIHQTKNSIEIIFSPEIVERIDTEKVFIEAFYITNMFRFASKGKSFAIVLDIIKLEKHPIYYLVSLLNKICEKCLLSID